MNSKLNVILCAFDHLPSGVHEAEFEAHYNTEIKPLTSALDKFPQINVVFHYSGVILHWIERRHPELFMLFEDFLSRKQAELLGGGFYSPVFPLLPQSDKIGQIEMLTTYLRKQFGKRPQGCWLPDMSWDQNLVGALNSCGLSYTFLDEEQFSRLGIKAGAGGIYSPCLTEDQGKLITVFPLAVSLGRELLNGKGPEILNELLEKLPQNENDQVLVIPIGRNFSAEKKINNPADSSDNQSEMEYEKLFDKLSNLNPRIRFTTPSKIHKTLRFLGKNYFPVVWPSASGSETHPRQFIINHPEAGGIYAKMIYVHTLINNQLRGDKTRKRTAMEEHWKAQDSGIFRLGSASSPGLFHSPVRKAAYRSLIEAEKITREKRKFTPSLSVFDFDLDGEGEYIFLDDKINCCIKNRGAGIFELDYLPAAWNYLDTLVFDESSREKVKRCSFADWLIPAKTIPDDAGIDGFKDGRFCGNEEFEISEIDRLRRQVIFRLPPKMNLPWGEIEILKTWQQKKNFLSVEYLLKNTGTKTQTFMFSPSIDLSFPGEAEEFLRLFFFRSGEKEAVTFNNALTITNIKALEFQDIKNEALIYLESSRSFDARLFQIRSGFPGCEEYQSSCVMPILPLSLEEGKTWKVTFSLKIYS